MWHNIRLLAVDGTRLVLPNHPTVVEEFGVHQFGPKADSPRSLAMGSLLYDVLNLITIDSQIAPYASSERDLLMRHLDQVKPGDLLLLDRGYALATTMDMLLPTFIHKKYKEALHAFDLLVWNTREIIRPGRSNPRNKKPKRLYSMNYKRL